MDDVGGPRHARELEQQAKAWEDVKRDVHGAGNELDRTERSMARVEQRTTAVTRKTREAHLQLSALGKVIGALKWPALISGIGGATQVLGGLTAGVGELIPMLGQVSGAAAAGGVTMVGLGESIGVVKLATHDLTKALGGNEKAIKALTPEGRAFLQILRSYQPEIARLQRTAQRGLFPGAGDLLSSLRSDAPQIRRIVSQVSRDLGGLGSFAGGQFGQRTTTGRRNISELVQLSDEGSRAFGAAARSATYLSEALLHVLVAAGPLTDWLGTSVEHWAKMREEQARVASETGRLDRYFGNVRHDLEILGDTGHHALHGLYMVMHAFSGESHTAWQGIDGMSRRFDHYASSVRGQTQINRWIIDMQPVLHETVGLVGDLAKGVGELSRGPEGAQMLHGLRQDLPDIERSIKGITSQFGPVLVDSFGEVLHLMSDASSSTGPLTLVVKSLGQIAHLLDVILQGLGPIGPALVTAFAARGLLRRTNAVDVLQGKWGRLRGTVTGVAEAERAAGRIQTPVFPAGTPAPGGRGAPGGARGVTPITAPGGLTMTPGGVILPAGVTAAEERAAAAGGAGLVARGRAALGGSSLVAGGTRVAAGAGRFLGPTMALSGLLSAVGSGGDAETRVNNAISGALFNLVPSIDPSHQAGSQRAQNFLGNVDPNSDPAQFEQALRRRIARRLGRGFSEQTGLLGLGAEVHYQPGMRGHRIDQAMLPTGNDEFFGGPRVRSSATNFRSAAESTVHALRSHGGERANNLATEVQRLLDVERNAAKEADRFRKAQQRAKHELLDDRSVRRAGDVMKDLGHAFDIESKRHGPVWAMKKTAAEVLREQANMRPAGAKVLDENALAWAKAMAKHNPALKGLVTDLENHIKHSFSRAGRHVEIINGRILTGSKSEWQKTYTAITTYTEKAREEGTADFTALQQQAIGSLISMGFSRSEAQGLVRGIESGGATGRAASNAVNLGATGYHGAQTNAAARAKKHKARGGRLQGTGLQDTIWLPGTDSIAAPGEMVVNRHTERDDDRDKAIVHALTGIRLPTIDERVNREHRPHAAPMRTGTGNGTGDFDFTFNLPPGHAGRRLIGGHQHHATGGRIDLHGARPGMGPVAALAQDRFGLHVTAGRNDHGKYTSTGNVSDHFYGRALDLSNGVLTPQEDAFNAFSKHHLAGIIKQLIWRSVDQFRGFQIGDHIDHVHFAELEQYADHPDVVAAIIARASKGFSFAGATNIGGGQSGAIQQIPALHAPRTGLRGVPGALAQRAGDLRAAGMTKKINARLRAMGGAGPSGMGGGAPFSGGGHFVATAYGPPWNSMEGGGQTSTGIKLPGGPTGHPGPYIIAVDPSVIPYHSRVKVWPNPFGYRGYFRAEDTGGAIKGHRIDFLDMMGRAHQDQWGRRDVQVSGQQLGGRVASWGGWNKDGGQFVVRRPTVFGAGEGGHAETVSITPHGTPRARGGRAPIRIERGAVQVTVTGHHNRDATVRLVDRRLRQFAEDLAAEMQDGAELDPDEALT